MTSSDVDELRAFLRAHVSSFEELEVLLFLANATLRVWSVAEVAAQVKLSEDATESALEALATTTDSLLERASQPGESAAFRYAPSPEQLALLLKLQRFYDEQRLSIVQIMSSNAVDRVRSSAARQLAEAFRLDGRKKK